MQPPALTPPPLSLHKLWVVAIFCFVLLIGRAFFTKNYKAEVNMYLKSVGRSDLIAVTEADKHASLSDDTKWTRADVDAILNKLGMTSVAPSAGAS